MLVRVKKEGRVGWVRRRTMARERSLVMVFAVDGDGGDVS